MTFDVRGLRGFDRISIWMTWYEPFGLKGARLDILVSDDGGVRVGRWR